MMTILTHVYLKVGAGADWDGAMRTRLSAAKKRPGWIGGQLLRPTDRPDRRVIVGTWKTVADWEAWHLNVLMSAGPFGSSLRTRATCTHPRAHCPSNCA